MKPFSDIFCLSFRYDLGTYEIVKPGKVSPELLVPDHIQKPPYYFEYLPPCDTDGKPAPKLRTQVKGVRESGKIAANILKKTSTILQPGITTDDIDKFIHNEIIEANAYPSPLRYADFPKSVCTSVNNVVCHGIPDDRPLADGDIINIDITVSIDLIAEICSLYAHKIIVIATILQSYIRSTDISRDWLQFIIILILKLCISITKHLFF